MRIDKFLWYSRIYKSRTIASNACKKGHVKIDSTSLKPSYEVFPNMILYVKKNFPIFPYSSMSENFQEICRKFPTVIGNLEKNSLGLRTREIFSKFPRPREFPIQNFQNIFGRS